MTMINHDRPTAAELLEIMAETLKNAVVPATDPAVRHQARVAANLAAILKRELENETTDAVTMRRLELVLNLGPATMGIDSVCHALRTCHDDVAAEALPLVMELVRNKLAVSKPGYDAHDAQVEANVVA